MGKEELARYPTKERSLWEEAEDNYTTTTSIRAVATPVTFSPHVSFRHIPALTSPQLGLESYGPQAKSTAFKLVGYGRRVAKRKGFSDDPEVMAERVAFAEEGLTWTPERLFHQIFFDEVWASGGAHTQS